MDQLQLNAPLGNHVGRHWAVNPAGQQAHRRAPHTNGQAARAGLGRGVDIGRLFPHLHMDAQLRRMHIHLQMGIRIVEQAAHILGNFHAVHREMLVRPFGLYLEGPGGAQFGVQVILRTVENSVLVLGTGQGAGNGNRAEHLPAGPISPIQVTGVALRLHINCALLGVHPEAAIVGQTAADIAVQLVLKGAAVQALEHHLAQLHKNDIVHDIVYFTVLCMSS